MNYLKIKNFGPIKDATIELKPFLVLIGGQGTGKSTIAKLLCIFKELLWYIDILDENENIKQPFVNYGIDKYFCEETEFDYKYETFHITYSEGKFSIENTTINDKDELIKRIEFLIFKEQSKMIAQFGPSIAEVFGDKNNERVLGANRGTSFYIPADRNLAGTFSSSLASMILADVPIPKTLLNYISYFEKAKKQYPNYHVPVLNLVYTSHESEEGIIIEESGKKKTLPLGKCSSGIQSLIPMLMVYDYCSENRFYSTYVIEEPEQNLFPDNQYAVICYLISRINKGKNTYSHVITTHSPYILSALNNLMFAYEVGQLEPEETKTIIPYAYWIDAKRIVAYSTDGGVIEPIIDKELLQIEAERIDGISQKMNEQYERLLDLKIKKQSTYEIHGEI